MRTTDWTSLLQAPEKCADPQLQELQALQQFQVFQEMATHFKSVSRDSKSRQEFQECVSRVKFNVRATARAAISKSNLDFEIEF